MSSDHSSRAEGYCGWLLPREHRQLCTRRLESSTCVLLIHFNACAREVISVFVLIMNVMGTAVCAKACVIRIQNKKKDGDQTRCHTPYLPPPQTIVLHMSLSDTTKQFHFP